MVRRAAELYRSLFSSVTVITGFEAERIEHALEGIEVSTVFNPNYAVGQQQSVHEAIMDDDLQADAILIALADQPFLTEVDILNFAQTFLSSDRSKIYVPFFQSQRGNPVIFPTAILREMKASGEIINGRKFIEDHPESVYSYKASTHAFVSDIDTGNDLALLEP